MPNIQALALAKLAATAAHISTSSQLHGCKVALPSQSFVSRKLVIPLFPLILTRESLAFFSLSLDGSQSTL
jgi:hypothetical protein